MEKFFKSQLQYNQERKTLKSENEVIERLLERRVEMQPVYDELAKKLSEPQQETLWGILISAAAFWNLDEAKKLRAERKKLLELNETIAFTAKQLASFMRERGDMTNLGPFNANEDYHFAHWVTRAGKKNYLFESYIKESFDRLRGQYDLKYWPKPYEVIEAIADYADEAEVYSEDNWTNALISSPKSSKSDFLNALLEAMADGKDCNQWPNSLPEAFHISDASMATIYNCTLDLSLEEIVDATYIKRSRQNIREREKQKNESYQYVDDIL